MKSIFNLYIYCLLLSFIAITSQKSYSQSSDPAILIYHSLDGDPNIDPPADSYCLGEGTFYTSQYCSLCMLCDDYFEIKTGTSGVDYTFNIIDVTFNTPGVYEVELYNKGIITGIIYCQKTVYITIGNCVRGYLCKDDAITLNSLEYQDSEYSSKVRVTLTNGFTVSNGQKFRAYLCSDNKNIESSNYENSNMKIVKPANRYTTDSTMYANTIKSYTGIVLANSVKKSSTGTTANTNSARNISTMYSQEYIVEELICYPNPNSGKFSLHVPIVENNQKMIVEIYNVIDHLVYRNSFKENLINIDISEQPKGSYVLKAYTNSRIWNQIISIN